MHRSGTSRARFRIRPTSGTVRHRRDDDPQVAGGGATETTPSSSVERDADPWADALPVGRLKPLGSIVIPIRTRSLLNEHVHWRTANDRRMTELIATTYVFRCSIAKAAACRALNDGARIVVAFTRVGPKPLDRGDNLNSSFKHVRDQICAELEIDDGSHRVGFTYAQRKGPFAVEVSLYELSILR